MSDAELAADPQESDPELAAAFEEAHRLAEEELADKPKGMGFCHLYWKAKKRILRKRFGIKWKTPAEMNPYMRFA